MAWARVPLVAPALAFAAGIAAAPRTPPDVAWPVLIGALAWGASLLVLDRPGPAVACLLAGVAAAGALRAAPLPPPADHVVRLALPVQASLEGRLLAEPTRFAPDRARVLVEAQRADGEPRSGRVSVSIYGPGLANLVEGQRVAVRARLSRPVGFRNPGGDDAAARLERDGILVVGTARAEDVTPLDEPGAPWHARVRRAAREAMLRALPPASAALLAGLVLGERGDLPREIDDAFRRAGVYHVLAVSGFNVALVAGSVWAVLSMARAGARAAALGAIVAIVGFALVVGPQASVLRAMVMGVVVLGGRLLDRDASVVNSVALAALLILAARPGDLLEPGFQLSFAATAGIVLAPLPRGVVLGALGVSLAAQLAVLPIGLAHFNQLSLIGPLANLAIVPLAGVATLIGLLAVALALVHDLAGEAFFNAIWPVLLAMRACVALAARVPAATVYLPAPHWTAIVAYAGGLGLAWLAWHARATPRRSALSAAGAVALLATAAGIFGWTLARPADGRLRVTVLDVGQGDAIVVEAPRGGALLVDAGPGGPARLDTGERVVAPFLWNRGVLRLDALIATHADADHAGGVAAIRRRFAIAHDWDATTMPRTRQWIGGMSLLPLEATLPLARPARPNEEAIVLRLDYGLASFLLAADAPAIVERALADGGAPLAATVLKVGHHGSRGSSSAEFLARVRPALAVVSVGRRNPYGHPAPETLARLTSAGAATLRTDRDGAVVFETDGSVLTVTRWARGAVERYCLDPERIC